MRKPPPIGAPLIGSTMNQLTSVTITPANRIQPQAPANGRGNLGIRQAPAIPHKPPQKADETMDGTPQGGMGRQL